MYTHVIFIFPIGKWHYTSEGRISEGEDKREEQKAKDADALCYFSKEHHRARDELPTDKLLILDAQLLNASILQFAFQPKYTDTFKDTHLCA